jgi:D-alanine-D-alanine ligase
MRICVLSDETIEDFNPAAFMDGFDWELVTVEAPIHEFIRELSLRKAYDVYLNVFEGFEEDDDTGFQVIAALETLNLPFTGADRKFYNPTREEMQAAAEASGLAFARGFNAAAAADLSKAAGLRYPLMVKHPNSFGSTGMMRESRVESPAGLPAQFERIAGEFGSARVEEFIDGRELTCLVVDNPDDFSHPLAYPPAEIRFPAGESFMHVDVKWVSSDTDVFRLEDPDLAQRVRELSLAFYKAMAGVGYGRVDLRMRPLGELVIIEINPNCGILYPLAERGPADMPISWDPRGHRGFLERIFRSAILRRAERAAGRSV